MPKLPKIPGISASLNLPGRPSLAFKFSIPVPPFPAMPKLPKIPGISASLNLPVRPSLAFKFSIPVPPFPAMPKLPTFKVPACPLDKVAA